MFYKDINYFVSFLKGIYPFDISNNMIDQENKMTNLDIKKSPTLNHVTSHECIIIHDTHGKYPAIQHAMWDNVQYIKVYAIIIPYVVISNDSASYCIPVCNNNSSIAIYFHPTHGRGFSMIRENYSCLKNTFPLSTQITTKAEFSSILICLTKGWVDQGVWLSIFRQKKRVWLNMNSFLLCQRTPMVHVKSR